MKAKKVLISPSSFGACGQEPLDLLAQGGIEALLNPYGRRLSAEEVVELGRDCDGILAGVEPLTAEVMDRLPNLRCISRVGAGMQNVDLKAAAERGILVCNTPDGPTQAVAELTIGLTFALLRRIPLADRNLRRGTWKKEMGYLLAGKVVGVVGVGRIGRAVAESFLALGCRVIAADPNPDESWLREHGVKVLPLQKLLKQSDLVSLHLDLDPEEAPLLGAEELALMGEESFLLNLSRGEVVDEEALYQALASGQIAGAALDVFDVEPYHGPLTELDQVVLTPHLGSYAREGRLRMELLAVQNLLRALESNDEE